uniref:Uncharacterized protein n=1 Tax=Romanomermis culicivorax TaxID=13658 RepID=A0A915JSW0_ROMCU
MILRRVKSAGGIQESAEDQPCFAQIKKPISAVSCVCSQMFGPFCMTWLKSEEYLHSALKTFLEKQTIIRS